MKTPVSLPVRRCDSCGGTGKVLRPSGAQLRKLRLAAGVGLRELGRRTHLDDSRISRAETGKGPALNRKELRAYLSGLGLNPSAEGAAVQPSAAPTPQTPPPGNNHPGTTAGEDPSAAPSAGGLNR